MAGTTRTTVSQYGYDSAVLVPGESAFTNMNTNCQKRDYDKFLADLFKETHPMFSLITKAGGGVHPTDSMTFWWGEFEAQAIKSTVTSLSAAGALVLTADTTNGLHNGILIDDVLYNTNTGQYLLVTAKADATHMTVSQITPVTGVLVSGSGITAITATDNVVVKVGTARDAGSIQDFADRTKFFSYFREVMDMNNTCTIYDQFIEIQEEVANSPWEFSGLTKRDHQREFGILEHADFIAKNLYMGTPIVSSTKNAGKGFFNFTGIQTQEGQESTFSASKWDTFVRTKVMAKNRNKKMTAFVNGQALSYVTWMVKQDAMGVYWANQQKENDYGIVTSTLNTNHCQIELVHDWMLDDLFPSSSIFAIMDLNKVAIRYLNNSWMKVKKDVQLESDHILRDQIYSVFGLQLKNSGCHSKLELK